MEENILLAEKAAKAERRVLEALKDDGITVRMAEMVLARAQETLHKAKGELLKQVEMDTETKALDFTSHYSKWTV